MSLLKNWKKNRQMRIDAAIARKNIHGGNPGKLVMDTSKVDPKAKAFLEYVGEILDEAGVSSKEVRDQCCYDLFETMTRSFNKAALDRGAQQDKFLYEMAASLEKAGIRGESNQETIIIKFLAKFKSISGF